jgi:hypothetical protein
VDTWNGEGHVSCGSLGTLVQSVGSMCLVYFSKELGPFQAFLRFFDITSPSNGLQSSMIPLKGYPGSALPE